MAWADTSLTPAFAAWQKWAPSSDDRLGSVFVAMRPGNPVLATGVFQGPEEEADRLIAPLVAVDQPT